MKTGQGQMRETKTFQLRKESHKGRSPRKRKEKGKENRTKE